MNSKVLVLNQGYEPVGFCNVRKAILLLFLSKADLVEDRRGMAVFTVNNAYPFPSVIRLSAYVRLPYRKVELSRKNILRRDGFRCQYCGNNSVPLTIDHIFPRSRGGAESWENLITACVPCNNRKGSRTPDEAGIHLRTTPRKPNHIVFLQHFLGKIEEPWKPYLYIS